MEVNGYLPTRTRVLSSETGSNTPDLLSQYLDVDLGMTMDELEKIQTFVKENCYDDAFALLFIKQCNALNEILPNLFEKTTDYMELLLKLSYTSDGVVRMLVDTIPESNFDIEQEGQIEIIGWMYQYYNTELNEQVYDGKMSKIRITKELLPAATTIYTPDWAIQYMVQNSLGRIWLEGHPNDSVKNNWKYYLEEAEQEKGVQALLEQIRAKHRNLNPEDIKVVDPCMGSGHILVYCFDVLMQIYESHGYTQRDAVQFILENNLFGLDIDKRATQLAYFAVMMKARQYDRRIFTREIKPHVYAIEESNSLNRGQLKYFGADLNPIERNKATLQVTDLLETMVDAKEYGSILKVENYDWELLHRFAENINEDNQISMDTIGIEQTQIQLLKVIEIAHVMAQKYEVVVTNPPYLGSPRFSPKLDIYVKDNYSDVKSDLSMIMYKHAIDSMSVQNGYVAFITTSSWMSLSSFEKLRNYLHNKVSIVSLVDFGTELFDGKVGHNPIVAWVNCNLKVDYKMTAIRLVDYCYSRRDEKEPEFFEMRNRHVAQQSNFSKIPGTPVAYWLSENWLNVFDNPTFASFAEAKTGIGSGNTDYFMKLWFEINFHHIDFGKGQSEISYLRFVPINKGGARRKWYGNNEYVIKWHNNGAELKGYSDEKGNKLSYPRNLEYQLRESLTWGDISSGDFSMRYSPQGFFFSDIGNSLFMNDKANMLYAIGLCNTKLFNKLSKMINQTMHFKPGNMLQAPFILVEDYKKHIIELVADNIEKAKIDWDSYETSWDFRKHPIIESISKNSSLFEDITNIDIAECFMYWKEECSKRFEQVKSNEQKLNNLFAKIYGLQDEIEEIVEDKDVTINKADVAKDIRTLISYGVGCILGRYSLDADGLVYAGGEWDNTDYKTFVPYIDNCIPITDEEYFEKDIVGLFCAWMKTVFGEKSLETNLDFIAKALGNKGTTSREVIRNYFLNDFMKDHMKIYQKRPIYWMFDSGKQNGFKCLIYMHRYDKDTVGRVRSDYLRKTQEAIEATLKNAEYTIQNSSSAIDKANATKKRDKYIKQLAEIKTYYQAISHVALQRIDIDLDDGVKVNYEKFQNIEIIDENGKKQKINLLSKI